MTWRDKNGEPSKWGKKLPRGPWVQHEDRTAFSEKPTQKPTLKVVNNG
jgi:hypothetical protein